MITWVLEKVVKRKVVNSVMEIEMGKWRAIKKMVEENPRQRLGLKF